MLQMKSPMGLRARLIYQVRGAGGIGSHLGLACYQLALPLSIARVGAWALLYISCGLCWPEWCVPPYR